MWWNPYVVSAGASGAIFGLYGCLIGYLLAGSADVPLEVARRLQKNALVFLGYNLIWGFLHKGTDMAGHLGGLAGGLACGFVLAQRLKRRGPGAKPGILLQVAVAGLGLLMVAAASRPRTVDLQQELARFSATETRVQSRYNQALERARTGHLSDAAFAQIIDAEVIGPWRAARLRVAELRGLPLDQSLLLSRIGRYAEARERAWVVFAEALHQGNPGGVREAATLHAEAERQLKDLSKEEGPGP
jgi:rhomboid protease GluP